MELYGLHVRQATVSRIHFWLAKIIETGEIVKASKIMTQGLFNIVTSKTGKEETISHLQEQWSTYIALHLQPTQ
jgi:hypothetical protein|uniref:Uncharacterized protein n=1 Tax=Populus trichocarpa TaxID=3694 RepID=U5G1N2_POPTR